jgi:lactoylglutathione lyase
MFTAVFCVHCFSAFLFRGGVHAGFMSVKKLLHTRMRVDDLERTVKFYTEILGLEVADRRESPRGSKLVFLRTPNSEELLEITYYPASGPVKVQPDLMHLAFEVEDLVAFGKTLEAKGIKFSDGPTTSGTGSIFAFIDAPEGYEIELIQRPRT